MIPKRKNMICGLRKLGKLPNGHIGRLPTTDEVYINYRGKRGNIKVITCSQADARLIAKRINQFLDGGG